jgi:hypothetical protein
LQYVVLQTQFLLYVLLYLAGGGRGGGRSGGVGGGGGGERDGYVAAEEYDELSKLCDKLLGQQEQLQEEVRKQAEMLKVQYVGMGAT